MKYIINILRVTWFLIWVWSFIGIFYFVAKGDIIWSTLSSITFGMGFYQQYYLNWEGRK